MPSDTRTESPGTALRLPSSAKMLRLCACCAPSSIQLFFLNSCVLLLISRSHPFFETLAPPKLVHDIHDARFADGRPLWSGQCESSHLTLTFPFIAFFGGMGAKVALRHFLCLRETRSPNNRVGHSYITIFMIRKEFPLKLDRPLQHELLQTLADTYPEDRSSESWDSLVNRYSYDSVRVNIFYLHEHGLVDWRVGEAGFTLRATHEGMDFLSDDGGLAAILNVLTIRFHGDTLKAMIGQKIQEADLDPADKRKFVDALRALPADATKHLAMKLLDCHVAVHEHNGIDAEIRRLHHAASCAEEGGSCVGAVRR